MKSFKLILLMTTLIIGAAGLTACKHQEPDNVVKVGIIDGPDTATWEVAKKIAADRYGLQIQLVTFSDYNLPNEALNNGEIDANAFQHMPFLNAQIQAHGYKIIPIAKTFVYPIALYSTKIKTLAEIKNGDKIAIPNDPSNEARALLLLQQGGLIKLRKGAGINATVIDIVTNPKNLQIIELAAPQLPRALPDVTAAIINNDFAQPAGLDPKDGLLIENAHSPYMNIIAIRPDEKNSVKIKKLVAAFQTPEVIAASKKVSKGDAVAGW